MNINGKIKTTKTGRIFFTDSGEIWYDIYD